MEHTIPTQSQIEVIKSDWLHGSRDSRTFVHKNTKGAIKTKKQGEAYSDYFLSGRMSTVDLLKEGRQIAQNSVDILCPDPVKVVLGGADSFTDGKQIHISSSYFDDSSLTKGQKVDILVGYSVHEASHILHSDFKELNKQINRTDLKISELKRNIANIIEDERIEQLTGEDAPGLMDYVAESKRYTFETSAPDVENVTEQIPSFLNALMKAVRYPSSLSDKEVTDHFDALERCRHILTPFPASTMQVFIAADKIIDVMKEMIEDKKKEEQQKQQRQQSGQNGQNSGTQNSDGGQQQNQPKDGSNGQKQPDTGNSSSQNQPQSLAEAMSSQQAKSVMDRMEKACGASSSSPQNDCYAVSKNGNNVKYINGDADKSQSDNGRECFFCTVGEDSAAYIAALNNVKKFVPAMSRALICQTRDYDYELKGMEEGILDTSKLAYVVAGNNRVFLQRGEVTTDGLTLCILLDESGSMSGQKKYSARQTAVLINEAVRNNPAIRLFVYGYTNDTMNIYCEPGKTKRYALGCTRSKGGTPTGFAMDNAAKRIRRRSTDPCVMFVITDGAPDDHLEVRKQDEKLRKKGIFPIGLGICGAPVRDFKEGISMKEEMNSLPFEISRIINRKVKSFIRKNDSRND